MLYLYIILMQTKCTGAHKVAQCNVSRPLCCGNERMVFKADLFQDSSSIVKLDNGSRCVAFSPDGELLAVGLNNGSFRIYNCFTLQVHAHKRDRGAVILVVA